jgi:glycosyltransferase involved in cell wall biosynthesis
MKLRLCIVSFKECWRDEQGHWCSYGGFPLQVSAVASLFDETTLLIVQGAPRDGGIRIDGMTRVVPLRSPKGADLRRKISVATRLPYYAGQIARHVRLADVVHVPVPGDIPLLGMLIALVLRKRLIARYGSSWITTSQTTLVHRFTRGCMRLFAGGRNVMLATGDGTEAPASRMQWVFATALSRPELDQIRPDLDRGLSSRPRLVYAGRLSPEKGVAVLIDALALLTRDDDALSPLLTIVGDGPARAALQVQVIACGLQDSVEFAGHTDRAMLSAHLLRADVCVQPSLSEGFSKAWLDAMAHGLPVLASKVGAAGAVIGEDGERGWLVAPGSAAALAAALRQSLTEPRNWPALRHRCRAYVENRTLDAWAHRIGDICQQQWNVQRVAGKLHA